MPFPSKARVDFWIDSPIAQHFRMDHASTQNFKPTRLLTETAAFSLARGALDMSSKPGSNEREKARAKTCGNMFFEQLIAKFVHGGKKISKRNVLVYIQTFNLMEEDMRASADVLFAVNSARTDDAQRWRMAFHDA